MATYIQTVDIRQFATADEREALTREALTREVRRGLTARPRSLSPWMFYDAEGSRLFRAHYDASRVLPHSHRKGHPGGTRRRNRRSNSQREIVAIASC